LMRWCLIPEEVGPTLTCTKGECNVIAGTLSELDLMEEAFSGDTFAGDEEDFPEDFPLSNTQIAQAQPNDPELMDRCASSDSCKKKIYKHTNK
jgi:hypothetical protein